MNEFYVQNYTCENGQLARLVIPENATKNDLMGLKELLEIILKYHYTQSKERK